MRYAHGRDLGRREMKKRGKKEKKRENCELHLSCEREYFSFTHRLLNGELVVATAVVAYALSVFLYERWFVNYYFIMFDISVF